MEKKLFEDTLRSNLRRDPFIPFVVELNDGEQIIIADRGLAFNNGFAGYFSPDYDLIEFQCDEVRSIRLVKEEETNA